MIDSRFWIAGLAAACLAGAACHSVKPATPAPAAAMAPAPSLTRSAPPPPPPMPAVNRTVPPTRVPTEEELFARKSLDQLNGEHPLGDAFFDYDQFSLRDDARAALAQDADWLKRWSQTTVRVVGHADERGTAEYNLALGENRAKAVQDYLSSLGIPTSRITISSVGKDEPFCTGDNEACWSQNRRGHFVITAK
jgi:peptidoglycan-associated lipoprotein